MEVPGSSGDGCSGRSREHRAPTAAATELPAAGPGVQSLSAPGVADHLDVLRTVRECTRSAGAA